jgi:hypothetical protein
MSRKQRRKIIRTFLQKEYGMTQSEWDRWCQYHRVHEMDEQELKQLYRELLNSDPCYFDEWGNLDQDFG